MAPMTPMRMCFSNESLSAEFVRALSIDAKYFTLQCMGRHSDDLVYYQVISSLPADFLGDCVGKAGRTMDAKHEDEDDYEWWWLPTGGRRDDGLSVNIQKLKGAMVGDGWYNCAVVNNSIVASIDIKKGDEIIVGFL